MQNIFFQGLVLQASLILVLGAQNLFLIDVGLKRNHHFLAATICAVCDLALIMLGVLGVSALLVNILELRIAMGLIGASFLLYYAALKFKEVIYGADLSEAKSEGRLSKKAIVLATLGFTLLNPHVYIDTFFLIGGYSTRFGVFSERIVFGLGAGVFSIIWFYLLALCSSRFSQTLKQERNLRIIAGVTGLILAYLALSLGWEAARELLNLQGI